MWKEIENHPNYEISETGQIRNKKLNREVKGYLSLGYKKVNLDSVQQYVHRLVLSTYLRKPLQNEECCHINGDKIDNRIENLMWGTKKINASHRRFHGSENIGEKQWKSKLTPIKVKYIRSLYKPHDKKYNRIALAKMFNVSRTNIDAILSYKTWKHV